MRINEILQEIDNQADLYVAAKPSMTIAEVEAINQFVEHLKGMFEMHAEPND